MYERLEILLDFRLFRLLGKCFEGQSRSRKLMFLFIARH